MRVSTHSALVQKPSSAGNERFERITDCKGTGNLESGKRLAPYDFDFSIRKSADGRIHCDGWHVPTMGYPDGAPLSAYTCVHVTDTFQTSVCCMHACVYKIWSCTCRYTKIRVRWVKRIFLYKRIIVTMSHWRSINDIHRHENVGSHLRNTLHFQDSLHFQVYTMVIYF